MRKFHLGKTLKHSLLVAFTVLTVLLPATSTVASGVQNNSDNSWKDVADVAKTVVIGSLALAFLSKVKE